MRPLEHFVNRRYVDALELLTASVSFSWGLLLALPGDTYASTPTYDVLSRIVPEYLLGPVMMLLGFSKLVALLNGRRHWVGRIALVCFLMWTLIALSFLLSNFYGTAWVVYGHIAVCNAVLVVRYRKRAS